MVWVKQRVPDTCSYQKGDGQSGLVIKKSVFVPAIHLDETGYNVMLVQGQYCPLSDL